MGNENPSTIVSKTYKEKDPRTFPEGSMQWYSDGLFPNGAETPDLDEPDDDDDEELFDYMSVCEIEIPKLERKLLKAQDIVVPTAQIWMCSGSTVKAENKANRIRFLENEIRAGEAMLTKLWAFDKARRSKAMKAKDKATKGKTLAMEDKTDPNRGKAKKSKTIKAKTLAMEAKTLAMKYKATTGKTLAMKDKATKGKTFLLKAKALAMKRKQ